VVANANVFAPAFAMDAVKELDQLERLDEKAGFFAHLAYHAFNEGFTDLKHTAGERPMALEGFAATAHQEHTGLVDYDRAHTNERRLGKFSLYLLHSRSLRG
jgi:hypothetical protein